MFTAIMPEIAPIIEPKTRLIRSDVEKSNVKPSKSENTKNDAIVKPKPISRPLNSPFSLVVLSAQNVPHKIEAPFIISTRMSSTLSENPKNLKQNASASTNKIDMQREASVPREAVFSRDDEADFSIKTPFK